MKSRTPTDETYSELVRAYVHFNSELFDNRLPTCLFTLQRQKRTFGYYTRDRFGRLDGVKTDEIAINPEYFAVVGIVEILQTLVHEMTHLWQSHFGTPSRSCYHNKEWADKMETIGLMPSSTGRPGGRKVGQHMADYVLAGGRFEHATKQLLQDGFEITWYDRYPALLRAPAHEAASGGDGPGGDSPYSPGGGDTQHPGSGILPDHAWMAPSAAGVQLTTAARAGDRSNRLKYTCPSCSVNAWGKPSLHLVCGDCGVSLAQSETIEPKQGVHHEA
jgi:hypothetical protein